MATLGEIDQLKDSRGWPRSLRSGRPSDVGDVWSPPAASTSGRLSVDGNSRSIYAPRGRTCSVWLASRNCGKDSKVLWGNLAAADTYPSPCPRACRLCPLWATSVCPSLPSPAAPCSATVSVRFLCPVKARSGSVTVRKRSAAVRWSAIKGLICLAFRQPNLRVPR